MEMEGLSRREKEEVDIEECESLKVSCRLG